MARSKGGAGPGDPMAQAIASLARCDRTVLEMRRLLRRKGHAPAAIDGVIERLLRMRYLDDRAYAGRYAAWAVSRKGLGRAAVRARLAARGVEREAIDAGLAAGFGPAGEMEALRRALSDVHGPLDRAGARRLAARLARRGFPEDMIREALARRREDPDEPLPDEGETRR
ncbi:MAG TPA: RecX family transcriptional regulator [Candidatus Polarisedimenticolia bacterium]|nr:RecX family transcriptional regulator [Candidatus Polarisedimenticolia bacterium]